ncbi:enoyl-CoA hydratase/isomerase family protein [Sphingobium sp. KCTC 72723]|uniref:enoyl-CoA hydratase/isomerase family protein n=1 Tax=Sphingobium sp. KCTC 72723 TaxID=2733867 RepID=UPI00165DFBE4|nr:enoyl-CoA hydratase/isomerase family protein [Sphingobium sp. KCTC 72723]
MTDLPHLKAMRLTVCGAIATVTIDNPPLNLLDAVLFADLDRLGQWLESDTDLRVVVFESANADFFIAHADLEMLEGLSRTIQPRLSQPSPHQQTIERFRTLPQVTIGKLEGIARGGGSEFLLALDMRFGALDRAILGQPEVALGFPPGCGATQRLPRLVGRAHALEAILGGGDYDAQDAARIGWLNRALPANELGDFIDNLARRIASYPRMAIMAAKSAIDTSAPTLREGLCDEFQAFHVAYGSDDAQLRMKRAMARGFQTKAVETVPLESWLVALSDTAIDQEGKSL